MENEGPKRGNREKSLTGVQEQEHGTSRRRPPLVRRKMATEVADRTDQQKGEGKMRN